MTMEDRFKFRAWHDKDKRMFSFRELLIEPQLLASALGGERYAMEGAKQFLIPIQCTGLKDKNGKLIFEGDIVTVPYYDSLYPPRIEEVAINDCVCHPFNPWSHGEDGYGEADSSEVIGNIYENPELLD